MYSRKANAAGARREAAAQRTLYASAGAAGTSQMYSSVAERSSSPATGSRSVAEAVGGQLQGAIQRDGPGADSHRLYPLTLERVYKLYFR